MLKKKKKETVSVKAACSSAEGSGGVVERALQDPALKGTTVHTS